MSSPAFHVVHPSDRSVTSHPVTAVLWDIDGTLLVSGGRIAAIFLDAVQVVCGTRPEPGGLDFGGRLDPEIAAMLVTATGGHSRQVPDVLVEFERLVTKRWDALAPHVHALPGVVDLMAALDQAGVVQTVVTGNLENVGRRKLHAAGLIPPLQPSLGGFGEHAPDRAAVGQVALDKLAAAGWKNSADTTWIIGDTPRDLACARRLGLPCALVATGRHPIESLAGLGAELLLPGLAEDIVLHVAEESA